MAAITDPFAASDNLVSIAVNGAMNPAIHHPAWYRHLDLLSSEELQLATQQSTFGQNLSVPQQPAQTFATFMIANFTVGDLRITCLPQTWTITTTRSDFVDRIREIAGRVFTELGHTPINSYSTSFLYHRKTELQDVGEHLARLSRSVPFGILQPDDGKEAAQIRYTVKFENRDFAVDLQPSAKGPTMVFIGLHSTRRIAVTQGIVIFDLKPLLEDAVSQDRANADRWCDNITRALKKDN